MALLDAPVEAEMDVQLPGVLGVVFIAGVGMLLIQLAGALLFQIPHFPQGNQDGFVHGVSSQGSSTTTGVWCSAGISFPVTSAMGSRRLDVLMQGWQPR